MNRLIKACCAFLLACAGGGVAAHADTVTFTAFGSDSAGPVAATVTFTAISGGIDIAITNDEPGTLAAGQAVSSLSFATDDLGSSSGFAELNAADFQPVLPQSATPALSAILPADSSAPPADTGATTDFSFRIPGVTATTSLPGTISDVNIGFGPGPVLTLEANPAANPPTPASVPLPIVAWGGLGLMGLVALRQRFGQTRFI